jgi:hypothetical protein
MQFEDLFRGAQASRLHAPPEAFIEDVQARRLRSQKRARPSRSESFVPGKNTR